MWGNRLAILVLSAGLGPIPTCVGQPSSWRLSARRNKAYPHVCGATATAIKHVCESAGLSPRVWGNLIKWGQFARDFGPIPTCVGQPAQATAAGRCAAAYPHVCGATVPMPPAAHSMRGLSPRVWGNRSGYAAFITENGPIPTCVGQP